MIKIREARIEDYNAIKVILDESDEMHRIALPDFFKDPEGLSWNRDYIFSLINGSDSEIFVAEINNSICGVLVAIIKTSPQLAILRKNKFVVLDNIAVKNEYRNRGIGSTLLDRFEKWTIEKGFDEVELNVYEFNSEVIQMYQKLGFRTFSRRMKKQLRKS